VKYCICFTVWKCTEGTDTFLEQLRHSLMITNLQAVFTRQCGNFIYCQTFKFYWFQYPYIKHTFCILFQQDCTKSHIQCHLHVSRLNNTVHTKQYFWPVVLTAVNCLQQPLYPHDRNYSAREESIKIMAYSKVPLSSVVVRYQCIRGMFRYLSTKLHSVMTQQSVIVIFTAMRHLKSHRIS